MRFPNYNSRLSSAENRRLAEDYLRQSGTEQKPRPPRGLIAQPASRGFLVSWSLPEGSRNKEIVSWRIYKDNENALYKEIADRGNRQVFVESTGGNSPPKVAAFISSMNAYGRESNKVQIVSSAAVEVGVTAPPNPGAPPGYTAEGGGGGDRTVRDRRRVGVQL